MGALALTVRFLRVVPSVLWTNMGKQIDIIEQTKRYVVLMCYLYCAKAFA